MEALLIHIPKAIAWSLAALVTYFFLIAIYNIFFHPLRHYPGPVLHRASPLPRALRALRGRWTRDLLTLAEQYGPVVRVAPNVLQYTDPAAWKDIYSHANGALAKGEEFGKDPRMYRSRGIPPNMLAETRDNHALLRRQLSHGFSEKVLREQEPIIMAYIDLFIRRLRERSEEQGAGRVNRDETATRSVEGRMAFDMKQWFNYVTFDVIGDLAFGEPFGCLEKAALDERVNFLDGALQSASVTFFVKEIGLERLIPVFMKRVMAARKDLVGKMMATLKRRIDLGSERSDLIEGLLKKREVWNLDLERIRSNATLLVVAGSETTATILTGVLYLLLSHPATLTKLQHEVRSTFASEDEITFTTVDHKLPYMIACLKEGLRVYPPVAGEMDRVVPTGGATIAGRYVPAGVTVGVAQYASNHASKNFSEPFAFRPERWLESGEKWVEDRVEALQPFSTGPRNCIGKNLAYSEMRTILARLVWNFDMELVKPDFDWLDQDVFFLWMKHPLEIYLTPVRR